MPLSRRTLLRGSALAAISVAAGSDPSPGGLPSAVRLLSTAKAPPRPNIVVLVTDDQPLATDWATPALRDHMGAHGVTYPQAYATTPLCAPSRASILTGRYAHNHGVRNNSHSRNIDFGTTVQRYLHGSGYRTGLFGKLLNGFRTPRVPAYFEEWAVMGIPHYADALWNINGTLGVQKTYTTTLVRDHAVEFMRKAATDDRPWFVYVSPYAPHTPYVPERRYKDLAVPGWKGGPATAEADKSDKPPYLQDADGTLEDGRDLRTRQLRALRSVDDLFAALVAELRATGQLDNTLILMVGDNGYSWADHGWLRKSVPYRSSLRVPMYASWPDGGLDGGREDGRLAANIDLAPTILDAAQVSAGPRMDGRSLLQRSGREELLTEWWHGRETYRNQPPTWAGLVSAGRQYTEYYDQFLDAGGVPSEGTGEVVFREYYDLAADPDQLVNLLHGADAAALRRLG
ncbi:MAG: sulfatase, partial [Streptosporangiaceae bacterium]